MAAKRTIREVAEIQVAHYRGADSEELAGLVAAAWKKEGLIDEVVTWASKTLTTDIWRVRRQSALNPRNRSVAAKMSASQRRPAQRIEVSWVVKIRRAMVSIAGVWVVLDDCTADQIDQVAEERQTLARKNMAWADRYTKLSKALRDRGAETVSELPDDVLTELFDANDLADDENDPKSA